MDQGICKALDLCLVDEHLLVVQTSSDKVCEPYVVSFLNWSHIFTWFVVKK